MKVYEECRLLRFRAVWVLLEPTCQQRPVNQSSSYYNVVPSYQILSTLKTEETYSSETSVIARATKLHIPEDGILHSHRHENIKSYIALTGWAL
jgi:hypothetical protein